MKLTNKPESLNTIENSPSQFHQDVEYVGGFSVCGKWKWSFREKSTNLFSEAFSQTVDKVSISGCTPDSTHALRVSSRSLRLIQPIDINALGHQDAWKPHSILNHDPTGSLPTQRGSVDAIQSPIERGERPSDVQSQHIFKAERVAQTSNSILLWNPNSCIRFYHTYPNRLMWLGKVTSRRSSLGWLYDRIT